MRKRKPKLLKKSSTVQCVVVEGATAETVRGVSALRLHLRTARGEPKDIAFPLTQLTGVIECLTNVKEQVCPTGQTS